jgi:CysZ protein
MLKEIIISIQAWLQAHRFIVTHKLWRWILIPGIIYAVLFWAGVYLFWNTSGKFIGYSLTHTGIKGWLESFSNSGFVSFVFLLIQIALQITLFYFYFSLFKYLFLIIGSPVFAYLSEKTQSIIDEKEYPFSFRQLLKDMARGIKLAFRNAVWQTVYSICILLISFIPVIGLATVLLAFFIECYYLGFSMIDYSCERNKLSSSQSIAFIGKHKGLAIGNGAVFYFAHLFPVIGWVLAPGYAVIAATISLNNIKG